MTCGRNTVFDEIHSQDKVHRSLLQLSPSFLRSEIIPKACEGVDGEIIGA